MDSHRSAVAWARSQSARLIAALGLFLAAASVGCGDDAASPDGADGASARDGGGGRGARDASRPMDDAAEGAATDVDASNPSGEPDAADASVDSGVPASTSIATYCSEGASGYFDWLQTCYGAMVYGDERRAEFVERLQTRCMHAERAVAEGRLSYDGVQATRCLAARAAIDCAGQYEGGVECDGVFSGLVPPDGDCYDEESRVFLVGTESCAEGFCENTAACPGRCRAYTARGASCETVACGPGDFCRQSDQTCQPRARRGEACGNADCALELSCAGDSDPKCVAIVSKLGDPCDDATPCGGTAVCIDGRCSMEAGAGQPCKLDANCGDALICTPSPQGGGNICLVPGALAAPCKQHEHCQKPLVCVGADDDSAGACAADPATLDQPCDAGRCADGLWCSYEIDTTTGRCRPRVGHGEGCTSAGMPVTQACLDGLHCSEAGTCAPPGDQDEPCNVFEPDSCTGGSWCSRETGRCVAPAGENAPCNPIWPDSCRPGLGCACALLDRDMCGSTTRAPSATDTCKPLLADGEPCYRTSECTSGQCLFDFTAPASMPGQCMSPPPACLP